jgi:putative MFS transporter
MREERNARALRTTKKAYSNQWKLICTANVADLLDFFDFFLIGYVTAALTKEWSLPIGKAARSSSPPVLARYPAPCVGLARRQDRPTHGVHLVGDHDLARDRHHGLYAGTDGIVPGWLFLMFFRFFVGIGNAGIFTIDLRSCRNSWPAYKRGWVSALITTLLPAGSMLAGIIAASLLPVIGWRGLFLVGLSPLVLVFMIRYWVPESPRWLMRMGRMEEARKSLAWALMIDPKEIALPAAVPPQSDALARAVQISRLVAAGCLTGMTRPAAPRSAVGRDAACRRAEHDPAHAAFLMIFFNLAADSRAVQHHRTDRAAGAARLGHALLRHGGDR